MRTLMINVWLGIFSVYPAEVSKPLKVMGKVVVKPLFELCTKVKYIFLLKDINKI